MAHVGLLGGTFNPPHVGHLICAQEALEQLELDRVVLVPVHTPPHKEVLDDPGPELRLELCRRATEGDERLGVSDAEVLRGGPSYTVDTLRAIHAADPGDSLTFIVGGDVAHGLPSWREPAEVLRLARLAVAERSGVRRADIAERVATVPGGAERVVFFDMPRVDLSSSLVRRHAAAGRSIRYLVPDAVAACVQQHGLYAGTNP
ncbi:nicotinate-nucleotide adenylyltransferase [Conexibacter sp. SYSU D00693]|uniref:nicotinate-nucleotide adenylyltransferase n=1 Tax=Conexibacter sp. SYSU D00693 TaxID=2812560 RepID=UPI00196AE7C2|nr:nicotinate-nucleotide adenylyltransferase [Conexibacter sp. SYSU D00693]